ncbi:MAG: hypothetical protein QOE14_2403, partial [Humisphaera sp.]|nr:hypothetical protein [Humisphaera sp.]
ILTAFKGAMYFLAFEPGFGSTGGELYRSDGTEAGTGIFVDLFPGPTGANVTALKAFGDYLYFAGDNGAGAGRELWRTNGTPGNVEFVKDINPGSANASIGGNTVSGNFMYFWATTALEGEELWRTDGTNGGTIRMSNNLAIGTTIGFPTDVNGSLYYTVHNSSGTFTGLWKSDGFGSVGVATSLTNVSSMLNINGTLYISGTTSANGAELYKIGPGDTSPVLVKDIVVGSSSSSPGNLAAAEGTLFFSATTSANGAELWKSDGTAAGTVLVKDIRLGSTGSSINSMVGANGVAYFRADDGINGGELWRSDGTAAGTYLLKDITPPGATTGNPTRMYAANGFVYFAATDDNSSNYEAWRTDGTPEGTAMLGDYYPEGSFFNNPANAAFFTAVNGEVFYRFADDTHGGELWKADLPDFAVLGAGGVLTISATANNDVIDLSTNGAGGLVVTLNGLTETFAPGAVTSINLVGRIGRDTVNVNSGTIAFSTDGGAATANLTLRVASGASAAFNATQHLAALELDGGLAALAPGHDKLLVVGALSITNNGRLDLADNSLVLDYSSAAASPIGGWNGSAYDGVTGLVQTAHNGGGWDGSGIATSMSDAAVGLTTLGIGEASDVLGISAGETALWNGQTVDASSVIIKYTYSGDANLDGFISGDDYSTIDFYVGTSAFGYYYGDFNFDGIISGDDYSTIDFNYGAQGEPL